MPGAPFEPFRQKIILDRQPPDLGMQFLNLFLGRAALPSAREDLSHPVDGLPLLCADVVWVQLVLRGNLMHGLVTVQSF